MISLCGQRRAVTVVLDSLYLAPGLPAALGRILVPIGQCVGRFAAFACLLLCVVLTSDAAELVTTSPQTQQEQATSAEPNAQFGFAQVQQRAAQLAAKPYVADRPPLPDSLRKLSYDDYRDIRFKPEKSLWRDERLAFEVQSFLRGFIYAERVRINSITNGKVEALDYKSDLFNFGHVAIPEGLPADLGFAGFRLHYPLNREDSRDEVAVFLGASYFRFLGQQQHYGLSARGLAIDTALSSGEEFPVFREFWLQKPEQRATEITVYALLDSPRVTGAYRFAIKPGLRTLIEVKAHLYFRDKIAKLGIAPLTSMFLHGKTTERYVNDFRPEVHDSDGLLIATRAGERIWRPLVNPKSLRISAFQTPGLQGFGLLQRERRYSQYEDLEAHYQLRPSVWIEPIGDWGKGVVELVEIPSPSERHDNIVAYWVPEHAPKAGQELVFEYRLRAALEWEGDTAGARVIATRIGAGGAREENSDPRKFVIDFFGPALKSLAEDQVLEAAVTASKGKLSKPIVQFNSETGGRQGRRRRGRSRAPADKAGPQGCPSRLLRDRRSHRLRPSTGLGSSLAMSTPSRQRTFMANMSLPSLAFPRANDSTPQLRQNM